MNLTIVSFPNAIIRELTIYGIMYTIGSIMPAKTKHRPNVGPASYRRWIKICLTLGRCFVFARISLVLYPNNYQMLLWRC